MKDRECIEFLQWALPKLEMRWAGFRKVRKQVCKRINRRINELTLSNSSAYMRYLDSHPEEWSQLDSMCRITISRFYRDRGLFSHLEKDELPEIARKAIASGEKELRCWSIGCASGEEAYTVLLIWKERLKPGFPAMEIKIIASDSDPEMIRRAEAGCYTTGSMKDLPEDLMEAGFDRSGEQFCIKDRFKNKITFLNQDIREAMPDAPFHLILCRNLVFTYFNERLQQRILKEIRERLTPGGILVTGIHETLPAGSNDLFLSEAPHIGIYRSCLRPWVNDEAH